MFLVVILLAGKIQLKLTQVEPQKEQGLLDLRNHGFKRQRGVFLSISTLTVLCVVFIFSGSCLLHT